MLKNYTYFAVGLTPHSTCRFYYIAILRDTYATHSVLCEAPQIRVVYH